MKIADLFTQLSYGELSNLAISEEGSGQIVEDQHPKLIHYLNDGLLELYTRFVLRKKDMTLIIDPAVNEYLIEPDTDDFLKILQVFDSTGCELPLNAQGVASSLFTSAYNRLVVPYPVGNSLTIRYQARHPKIEDTIDPSDDVEFDIPIFLENTIQLYIAHKVFKHMNGQENTLKGQELLAAYEADCLEIEQSDLVNQTHHTSHTKLEQRGFK